MDWLKQNLGLVAGISVGLVLVYMVVKAFGPKKRLISEGMSLNVRCPKCKWQGVVTKYNQVCRKCGCQDLEKL